MAAMPRCALTLGDVVRRKADRLRHHHRETWWPIDSITGQRLGAKPRRRGTDMDHFNADLNRRSVLKGLLAAGGFAVTPGLLAACGSSAGSSGGGSTSKVVTVTSRFPTSPSRDAYQ